MPQGRHGAVDMVRKVRERACWPRLSWKAKKMAAHCHFHGLPLRVLHGKFVFLLTSGGITVLIPDDIHTI